MIVGASKRMVQSAVKYYVDTTGCDYYEFIFDLGVTLTDTSEYHIWLAHNIMALLEEKGITQEELIQNKDILRSSSSSKGEDEGEFYTPEIWCKEGREYLKRIVGDLWGKAYIWDASCGTGNLLRSAGYPQDKVFLSTLLAEDVEMVKQTYPEATVFQCNFLNGIDYDENNRFFSDTLPEKLQEVLKNDEPIIFLMNPPYRQGSVSVSDIGEYMVSEGIGASARDICGHFFYRLIMLKRHYNLTNMTLGLYHPASFLTFKSFYGLMDEMVKEFKFEGGMVFTASDFAGCKCGVSWCVAYTTWHNRDVIKDPLRGTNADTNFLLDAKTSVNDEVKFLGKRLFGRSSEYIDTWAKDRTDAVTVYKPLLAQVEKFSGKSAVTLSNAIAWYSGSAENGRRGARPCMLSLPYIAGQPLTTENFWRVLAMCGVSNVADYDDPLMQGQYTKAPDVSIEGYEQWIIDCIPIMLFGLRSHSFAYRGVQIGREEINRSNQLFPLSVEQVKQIVTDEKILEDIEKNPCDNSFILGILKEFVPKFSKEARELYEFGVLRIAESLSGDLRKKDNYTCWTVAWDACLQQIKSMPLYWSDEISQKYYELVRNLRDKLKDGVFTFGFWEDINYSGGKEDEELQ